MMTETERVLDTIELDELTERLTGRGDGLRSSKPDTDADNGLIQYVWRMARFHAGYDTSMPVTAAWWLQEYVDELGVSASVSGVTDDAGTELTAELETVTERVLSELGEDASRGASRWAKTGAF